VKTKIAAPLKLYYGGSDVIIKRVLSMSVATQTVFGRALLGWDAWKLKGK